MSNKAVALYDTLFARKPGPIYMDSYGDAVRYVAHQARMGIEGNDPADQAERVRLASEIIAVADGVSDAAYQQASWMNEPDLPHMAMAYTVRVVGGDVTGIGREIVAEAVVQATDAYGSEEYVSDEDGPRYEWVSPLDDPLIAHYAAIITDLVMIDLAR